MKKELKVEWARPAHLDLIEMAEFIAVERPGVARKIVQKIRDRVSNLKISPERGRVVPELAAHGIVQYRELVVSPWRVLYRVDATVVYILLVVDGRRNLEDLLFNRIMRPEK